MLISFQAAAGTAVDASDGNVGSLEDLFFDRVTWEVRYLVVRSAGWLSSRKVLLAPEVIEHNDWSGDQIKVRLTRSQVRHSPEIDEHEPVSRKKEYDLAYHFAWKPHWMPGPAGVPDGLGLATPTLPERVDENDDSNLWNAGEVIGYDAHARDGDIGYVEDLIFDDTAWAVRYLVVDIGNRITGRRVLTNSSWIKAIDWETRDVDFILTRNEIEKSPEFDPTQPVSRDYENRLYDYYGRPKYWEAA